MTLEKDDPKLTAFALGELPPAERAEVEKALAEDPALQAELEAIQSLSSALGEALAAEPLPKLAETQRAAIEAQAGGAPGSASAAAPASASAAAPASGPKRVHRAAQPEGQVRRFPAWAGWAGGLCAAGLLVSASFMTVNQNRSLARIEYAPTAAPAADRPQAGGAPAPVDAAGLEREVQFETRGPAADPAAPQAEPAARYKAELEARRQAEAGRQAQLAQTPPARPAAPEPTRLADTTAAEPAPPATRAPGQQGNNVFGLPAEGAPAPAPPMDPQAGTMSLDADKPTEPTGGEQYARVEENAFLAVREAPLSTFSIDVDRASYALMRRWITQQGTLPPPDAVRIEELINYFPYEDAPPAADARHPFAVKVDVAGCPWNERARLVRIGLKGKEVQAAERAPANLVFLLDVSGSMGAPNKLPLVRQALRMLVENLSERDRVSIVVYAGASGLALPPTPCDRGQDIMEAFSRLQAGGSTNGGAGIHLAYRVAQDAFLEGGVNRVILCTDGDFNVGTTSHQSLMDLIADKARSKVFLTVLGFGMGNLKDHMMEQLANKGNGNYGYVDTIDEARKLLVDELSGTLVTIAKDVKIQVEWNPAAVQSYRLIGYENRKLRDEDFNDDTKDAGEIGAGHAVTALYEVVPVGAARPGVDPLKYQEPPAQLTEAARSGEMLTVKLRYKQPEGDVSELLDVAVRDEGTQFQDAGSDLRFAAAVAGFGMILRGSQHKGSATLEQVYEIAAESLGSDPGGHRREFLDLVRRASQLRRR